MTNEERIALIKTRLTKALSPDSLEIIDESHQHIGHPGAQSGAGHFALKIKATALSGQSRVKQHQVIYAELQDLIPDEIHALSIRVE
jgi:BolA protein